MTDQLGATLDKQLSSVFKTGKNVVEPWAYPLVNCYITINNSNFYIFLLRKSTIHCHFQLLCKRLPEGIHGNFWYLPPCFRSSQEFHPWQFWEAPLQLAPEIIRFTSGAWRRCNLCGSSKGIAMQFSRWKTVNRWSCWWVVAMIDRCDSWPHMMGGGSVLLFFNVCQVAQSYWLWQLWE